jgi:hypothetical protein
MSPDSSEDLIVTLMPALAHWSTRSCICAWSSTFGVVSTSASIGFSQAASRRNSESASEQIACNSARLLSSFASTHGARSAIRPLTLSATAITSRSTRPKSRAS